MSAKKTISVRLIKSSIGRPLRQKETVRSLGFTRLQQVKTLPDNPSVRGMLGAVGHLLEVVDADGKEKG